MINKYFEFSPAEYFGGALFLEDFKTQGAFFSLCAYYWKESCKMTREKALKVLKNDSEILEELTRLGYVKTRSKNDLISIEFLDNQATKFGRQKKRMSQGGKKGMSVRYSKPERYLRYLQAPYKHLISTLQAPYKHLTKLIDYQSTYSVYKDSPSRTYALARAHNKDSNYTIILDNNIKKEKKVKKRKKETNNGLEIMKSEFEFAGDADFLEIWNDWMVVRKKHKLSESDRAFRRMVTVLKNICKNDHPDIKNQKELIKAILSQSEELRYRDVYKLKENSLNELKTRLNLTLEPKVQQTTINFFKK